MPFKQEGASLYRGRGGDGGGASWEHETTIKDEIIEEADSLSNLVCHELSSV